MSRFKWYPSTTSAAEPPKSNAGDLLRLIAGGTLNYGMGQSLPLVIGFLLIPVYTAVLTPEDYGIVEVCAAIGGLLTVFMRFGVPGAVTRFYYEHPEGPELQDYVTSVSWFLRLNGLLVGALAMVAGYVFLPVLIPSLPVFPYVPLAILASLLATNSDVQRRLIQVRRQSSYSARLSLASSLIGIALTILLVVGLRLGALGMMLAQVMTGTIFLVNAAVYLRPDLTGRFKLRIVRESMAYGSGVFGSHFMAGAGPLVTRSLLAGASSIGAVGLFSLASRVISPLTIVSNAFTAAYVPEYFAARKDGSEGALSAIAKAERAIWTLGLHATIAVALLGPPVLLLLTPQRFHGAASLVPILALGFLGQLLYTLMSPEMFFRKSKWMPPLVTGSNLVTTLAMSVMLVGPYGAHGIAVASVAGAAVGGLVCGCLVAPTAPVPHEWPGLIRASAISGTSLVLAWLFSPDTPLDAIMTALVVLAANAAALTALGDPLMRRVLVEVQARLAVGAQPAK